MSKHILLNTLFLLFFVSTSQAAVIIATTTGNWTTASNWSLGRVPQAGDLIFIPAGIIITVPSGATIDLCGNASCTDGNAPTFISIQAATANGSNGGRLFFDGTGNTQPIMKLDNGSGLQIENFGNPDAVPENEDGKLYSNNNSINTFIQINDQNIWGPNASSCGNGNGNGNNNTSYPGCKATDQSGGPVSIGVVTPLPVTLLYFRATRLSGMIKTQWATTSETNNHSFTIEESVNGVDFQAVTQVAGAGNSEGKREYGSTFAPLNTLAEGLYYRLKQTDFDGTFAYSHVVYLPSASSSREVMIFPNPSRSGHSYVSNPDLGISDIRLFDLSGREVARVSDHEQLQQSEIPLPIAGLSAGTYCAVISQNNQLIYKKLQIE